MYRLIHLSALILVALGAALLGTSAFAQQSNQITVTTQFLTMNPNSSYSCDYTQPSCDLNIGGTQSSTPGGDGNYQIALTLHPSNATNTGGQSCIPTSGTTTLSFPARGNVAASSLVLNDGNLCFTGDFELIEPFSISSATGIFAGAAGNGSLTASWDPFKGFFTFHQSTVTYPAPGGSGGDNNDGNNGGGPFATPELGSLPLLGSGLLGLAGYGLARIRARRKALAE